MQDHVSYVLPSSAQTLVVRALTGEQMDYLISVGQSESKKLNVEAQVKVICESLNIPTTEFRKFLNGDFIATLIAIRRATFGDEYEYEVKCPAASCRQVTTFAQNLAELPVLHLEPGMPLSGLECEINPTLRFIWKLPTVGDLIDTQRDMELRKSEERKASKKKMTDTKSKKLERRRADDAITLAASSYVTDIQKRTLEGGRFTPWKSILANKDDAGYLRREEILEFFRKGSVGIAKTFTDVIDEFIPTVSTTVPHECPECGHTFEGSVPMREDFFFSRGSSTKSPEVKVATPWRKTAPEEKGASGSESAPKIKEEIGLTSPEV